MDQQKIDDLVIDAEKFLKLVCYSEYWDETYANFNVKLEGDWIHLSIEPLEIPKKDFYSPLQMMMTTASVLMEELDLDQGLEATFRLKDGINEWLESD